MPMLQSPPQRFSQLTVNAKVKLFKEANLLVRSATLESGERSVHSSDFDTSVAPEPARKILHNKSIYAEKNNVSRLAQFCTMLHNCGFHAALPARRYL